MKEELKQFGIDINTIKESNDLVNNISEAIHKMSLATMKDRFEIILNNNLIESKEKLTNYRTIFGCRISYENLDKNISFIVREDTEPSYEDLQHQLEQYKNILEDIDKYIHSFKIENIGEKTMLILNDILLIKNGLGKDVIRLNKMKELEEE